MEEFQLSPRVINTDITNTEILGKTYKFIFLNLYFKIALDLQEVKRQYREFSSFPECYHFTWSWYICPKYEINIVIELIAQL
jgi:hypothetical protein